MKVSNLNTKSQLVNESFLANYVSREGLKDKITSLMYSWTGLDDMDLEIMLNPYKYLDSNQAFFILKAIEALYIFDKNLFKHCFRVAFYSSVVSFTFERDFRLVFIGAFLHDIGKIFTPKDILNKPSKLSDEEYEIMKKHSEIGSHFCLRSKITNELIVNMVRHHHNTFDKGGYPKLKEEDKVSFETQIVTVCDCFDAMTSNRVYSNGKSLEFATGELIKNKSTQFNPDIVDKFNQMSYELIKLNQWI